MCTVIAKESASRVVVLTGIPCCVSVEDVSSAVPKVARANGWFELFVGELEEVPQWARWLDCNAKQKALENAPVTLQGKRVWFYDIRERYDAVFRNERRSPRVHFGREFVGRSAIATNRRATP
jgi:hypothetical protein